MGFQAVLIKICNNSEQVVHTLASVIGVNATGDAGDASPAIFGEPGTKCLISPQKPVKIVTNREAKKAQFH